MKDVCVVIPAAGKGSRLGLKTPKFLVQIGNDYTVADRLLELFESFDSINVIMSSWGMKKLKSFLKKKFPSTRCKNIKVWEQNEPTGMGDAIFLASTDFKAYSYLFVVWGDQALISKNSIIKLYDLISNNLSQNIVSVLLTKTHRPYVEYVFDSKNLKKIKESREGDICNEQGYSDCGLFALTTNDLDYFWRLFKEKNAMGEVTKETNFLPFLQFLCVEQGWEFLPVITNNKSERVGINTKADLTYVREKISKLSK